MKFKYFGSIVIALTAIFFLGSCKKFLDINRDPNNLPTAIAPIAQELTAAQMNLAFEGGSDLFRYAALIMQQMSGEASSPNQTWFYYRYIISGTDVNNVWGSIFARGNGTTGTLNNLEIIIKNASANGSPYYSGICKILKAYEYSLVVDAWGNVPYSESEQLDANTSPHYDDASTIYPKLITLLTDGVTDLNAASSVLSPGNNSLFYTNANFATAKAQWIKLANTLRFRLLLHYSKKDPAYTVAQITALINSGASFFASNADNLQMTFNDAASQRNPISQFEVSRANYLYADSFMVTLMNSKNDPRRGFYFTSFPYQNVSLPFTLSTSAAGAGTTLTFTSTSTSTASVVVGLGVTGVNVVPGTTVTTVTPTTVTLSNALLNTGAASGATIVFSPSTFKGVPNNTNVNGIPASSNYSRVHTFLRGAVTAGSAPPFTYSGIAAQRMFSFAEYNFIRAEAALMGAPGDPQAFFTAGITASMTEVGVNPVAINDYLSYHGTLSGTNAQKLQQIIEEKYVALFGVSMEPWSDYRRTGFPLISPPVDKNPQVTAVPRSLLYPQNEVDRNTNFPGQKSADMQTKVFWDN
jgi:hypothetical protein